MSRGSPVPPPPREPATSPRHRAPPPPALPVVPAMDRSMRRRTGTPDAPGWPCRVGRPLGARMRLMGRSGVASVAGAVGLGCAVARESSGVGADRHLTGVPRDLRLPVPLPGGEGGPCARLRRSVTVLGMASEQRAPAWLTGPCAGGPRPAWLTGKERRPRVTMQEAPGWAIAAALAALRCGRRSSRGGPPRAGETAFVGAMMRGGIRPTLFPACLRAAALSDRRGKETRRRSATNWLRRHVLEGLGMLPMRRTWRRERPGDFLKRRTVAKGRAKGEP